MSVRIIAILGFVGLLLIGLAVWWQVEAPRVEDVQALLVDKQAEATAKLAAQARAGDPKAQFALAEVYRVGKGVEANPTAALKWYEAAARQGLLAAQYELGRMYELGEGVKEDDARAVEWYRLAAQLGRYPKAAYRLGNMAFNGRGLPHDYNVATDWYRRAAERGHPVAQFLMGAMYAEGWGVDKDLVAADMWYKLAQPHGKQIRAEDQRYDVDKALADLEAKMSRFQLDQARERVRDWMPKPTGR